MSWLLTSGSQSFRASASESVPPMNIQGWFPLRLTGLISLLSKGLSKNFFQHQSWKESILWCLASLWSNSHPYMTTGKTIDLTRWTLVSKVMSLLYNTLKIWLKFVIAFLPRNKCLLILWLHSDLGVQENKICHYFHFCPIYLPWKWWHWMPWS